jgi:hypothetical protein
VHRAAALDHQPADTPRAQVGRHAAEVDRVAAVDHGGHLAEPFAGVADARRRAVDELLDLTEREEARGRVDVATPGDGDLHWVWPLAARHPLGATLRRAHQQARVVLADGGRADENRIDAGPHLVDTVEIGVVREHQPLLGGVVEVAVDGHAAAQERVRTVNHR